MRRPVRDSIELNAVGEFHLVFEYAAELLPAQEACLGSGLRFTKSVLPVKSTRRKFGKFDIRLVLTRAYVAPSRSMPCFSTAAFQGCGGDEVS